ncbi:hypothetical protein C0989_002585 [Termitomyces sp. Mn162]|nr:hypothetical protein C0989_002585 [Termitomyces sp. Mn162]
MPHIIALCMTSGKSGDVVASAFEHTDQGETIIYLARNGEPSPEDIASASDFLYKLRASKNHSMLDILSWIASHGPETARKRVKKLHEMVNKDKNKLFRKFLKFEIKNYHIPIQKSVEAEFPNSASVQYLQSEGYDTTKHIDSSTVQAVLVGILKKFDQDLVFDAQMSSHLKLESLVLAAATLRDSMFLTKWMEHSQGIQASTETLLVEKASQFCRNVNKVYQYVRIIDLIRYVQRKEPIKIEWVYARDMNLGNLNTLCYQFEHLELESALTIALRIVRQFNLTELTSARLVECFQRMKPFRSAGNPSRNRYVNTYVHAELKLIVFLLQRTPQRSQDQEIEHRPIGCSKRSCLYCTFWIEELQEIFKPTVHRFMYYTAGSHGSPYATCARVGPFKEDPNGLCSNKVEERLKGLGDQQVRALLNYEKGHTKKKSEDHASASDGESSEASKRFLQS